MALEEADHVQLLALVQAGITVPKTVKSAKDFTPEALNSVIVKCLRLIVLDDPSITEIPEKLPANVAARHRIATSVSNAIKTLGYAGEGGYNQLLYPNERDVRKLLSWVVSKLPRAEDVGGGAGSGMDAVRSGLLRSLRLWVAGGPDITAAVAARPVSSPPALFSCIRAYERVSGQGVGGVQPSVSLRQGTPSSAAVRQGMSATVRTDLARPTVSASLTELLTQPEAVAIVRGADGQSSAPSPSLPPLDRVASSARTRPLHQARPGLMSPRAALGTGPCFEGTCLDSYSSPFQRRCAFAITVTRGMRQPKATVAAVAVKEEAPRLKTEEELAVDREAEVLALQARLDAGQDILDDLAARRSLLEAALPVLQAQLVTAGLRTGELERSYLARKAALDMLPQAEQHLTRLAAELDAGVRKMQALAAEWESHRGPLTAVIAAEESRLIVAAGRAAHLSTSLADTRHALAEAGKAYVVKEEQAVRMAAELTRVQQAMAAAAEATGDGTSQDPIVTRPVYQRRIADIVRQIRKQKGEIAKIVADVRAVQEQLASVQEALRKIAMQATSTMEKAAVERPKDGGYRNALRQLISMQDLFAQLMATVSAIGSAENETRILDNRAEQMRARNDGGNTAALARDLAQLRAENQTLVAQAASNGISVA